jgi:hypothetical protein
MKKLKLYEDFRNQKWILGVNENIFDKIEDLVKGKSEKGKIIEQFLTKNGIQPKGSAYMVHFLGGSNPGKEELSHPFDYLHYTPGVAKITEDGVLELVDENAKKLQTPDTLSFLAVMEKDDIVKNWTFSGAGRICFARVGDQRRPCRPDAPPSADAGAGYGCNACLSPPRWIHTAEPARRSFVCRSLEQYSRHCERVCGTAAGRNQSTCRRAAHAGRARPAAADDACADERLGSDAASPADEP